MIARIKGLKISQASERTAVTGQEMIPFQDGERNGKIRMIEFKDMTMYIFDPTIVDGKVSQEDYDALKQAIEEGKLIYTINSNRNGLDLATEVAIVGSTIYIESPDFIKEEGADNISQVVFDTITVDGSLNYSKEQYTTTVIKTTGDGTKVLTDNGQYVYIGNLALTNIKFKDGTNTSTYDLVTNGITFRQNSTPCVSWNTVKSGNNIYMDIRIANATASMDGLMSKEDYVELNTTIPGQIEDLKEADSNLNNRIDDLDDKIDKEIADREAEIDRIENKFDGVTDALEDALQKEIEDRKAGDTTITNSLNAFISTKGQPSGLAELTQTGYTPPADNYVFTWEGGSTSDVSANFPWDFSANGTAANIPVISTKNGSSQSWSVSSKPSWITTSTTSSKITISASDNSGSARSGTIVLTQSGSNKTLRINVSQAAYSATVEWRYKFGFSNGARDNISIAIRTMKEYEGASVTFASYKSKYVDGVEDVSSRQYVDFSIGDYASWATVTKVSSSIANEGKFKFTLSSNFNNKSNRQTFVTVTQNESNKSITCDIMQVGSDAFVATYYSHVRGSDTYPDEISFGIVTTPTTKQYEWDSTFEVHTVDSDYDAYNYNYGAISEVKKVTANASMNTTWFGYEYIQDGGSYQYDLLKVNAPKSDGINHSEKLYILQLVTSAPSTSYNYREITNTPIAAEILVTQRGNTIS